MLCMTLGSHISSGRCQGPCDRLSRPPCPLLGPSPSPSVESTRHCPHCLEHSPPPRSVWTRALCCGPRGLLRGPHLGDLTPVTAQCCPSRGPPGCSCLAGPEDKSTTQLSGSFIPPGTGADGGDSPSGRGSGVWRWGVCLTWLHGSVGGRRGCPRPWTWRGSKPCTGSLGARALGERRARDAGRLPAIQTVQPELLP